MKQRLDLTGNRISPEAEAVVEVTEEKAEETGITTTSVPQITEDVEVEEISEAEEGAKALTKAPQNASPEWPAKHLTQIVTGASIAMNMATGQETAHKTSNPNREIAKSTRANKSKNNIQMRMMPTTVSSTCWQMGRCMITTCMTILKAKKAFCI